MEQLKKILTTFIHVLAGITISATIYITLFAPKMEFTNRLLWQIIAMSAISACGDLIFYSKKELSKQKMKLRMISHYIYVNIVVLGGGFLWSWVSPKVLPQILLMLVLIAVVYVGVSIATLRQEELAAEKINRKLSKFNSLEDE